MKNNRGLCFRCEHRATYLEEEYGPRAECKMDNMSVSGCYMFQPVKPICIKSREGDNRPLTLNYFSARVERVITPLELQLIGEETAEGLLVYWKPKDKQYDNKREI